ncbi:hypothetical protein JX265_013724 [Neoarthrinium moseri]|uniref:Uncharacterized protein n=1 Tax=Neoarthrinium moseri TaxID=1658444 RepID=A0A9Q0AIF0_9PEZI|nr:hypothetical protein JX265_013724 [Neoarthrinium moseri]
MHWTTQPSSNTRSRTSLRARDAWKSQSTDDQVQEARANEGKPRPLAIQRTHQGRPVVHAPLNLSTVPRRANVAALLKPMSLAGFERLIADTGLKELDLDALIGVATGQTYGLPPREQLARLSKPKQVQSFLTYIPTRYGHRTCLDDVIKYWGITPQDNLAADHKLLLERLDPKATSLLLGRSNEAFRSETSDILVAILDYTFRATFDDREPPNIFLEGHGREQINGVELDVSETVGWFTTFHPLGCRTPAAMLLLRSYNEAGQAQFAQSDGVEILLNYDGRFQQFESSGSALAALTKPLDIMQVSPHTRKFGLIEVTIGICQGQMEIAFDINVTTKHQERLRQWAKPFTGALRDVAHKLAECSQKLTLSNVPLLEISYSGFESLLEDNLFQMGLAADKVVDIYPCSPLRVGLQLSKKRGTASYANIWVWSCNVKEQDKIHAVSPAKLLRAWELTIARRAMFSTIFAEQPETGRMLQVLLNPSMKPRIRHVQCGPSSAIAAAEALASPIFEFHEQEYQVTICEADNGEVACRLDMSHALSDLSSVPVLVHDLMTAYSEGHLPPAPQFRQLSECIVLKATSHYAIGNFKYQHVPLAEACGIDGDDPHEFDLALDAELNGPETIMVLNFKRNTISDEVIQGVKRTLGNAVEYLVRQNDINESSRVEGLRAAFFRSQVGETEENVTEYWKTQFAGSEAAQFPALPSPAYRPRADALIEHSIEQFLMTGRDFTAATTVRAVWAIVQVHYTTANEAVFGVVVTGRQAPIDGIEEVAGPTIATVPVRVSM